MLWAAIAMALVACGQSAPTAIARPTEAGELVVRVETRGGLLPPLERERQAPEISIYGDGLVIVPAPFRDIFPGPAGYDLEAFRIEPGLIDDIVAEAAAIGLRGASRRIEQPGPEFVADAGATTITIVTEGQTHVTSADALFDTDSTQERALLADFVGRLRALRATADGITPYEAAATRVYVAVPDPGFGPDLELGEEVEWPFDDPLATWGEPIPPDGLSVDVRCRVVRSEELKAGVPVLEAANVATVVVDGTDRRIVALRPLLPDEDRC